MCRAGMIWSHLLPAAYGSELVPSTYTVAIITAVPILPSIELVYGSLVFRGPTCRYNFVVINTCVQGQCQTISYANEEVMF